MAGGVVSLGSSESDLCHGNPLGGGNDSPPCPKPTAVTHMDKGEVSSFGGTEGR